MTTQLTEMPGALLDSVPGHRSSRALVPALLLLLLVLVAAVYWIGLDGGFIFDDYQNIVGNPTLRVTSMAWPEWRSAIFSSQSGPLQRPLAMLSFATNFYFTGLDPRPMKLTNLAIHILNAGLVFGLCRSLFRAFAATGKLNENRGDWAALFVAACWALHPINQMAVLYVVQRMESLSHTFVFCGLWLYVLGRNNQMKGVGGWPAIMVGIVGGTFFGVMSKESAVLLSLYAFCLEFFVFRFRMPGQAGRDGKLIALFVAVLALPGVVGLYWLSPRILSPASYYANRDFSMLERLLTEPRVVLEYLHWSVLPDLGQLSLYHDDFSISRSLLDPPTTLLAIAAVLGLLAAAWKLRRSRPLSCLGICWFFAAQLLTATFIPLELMHEHRNYFASLGVCLVLADLLVLATITPKLRSARAVLALVVVVSFAGLTHLRAQEWSHPVRFAITEVAKHPQSPRATYELARLLVGLSYYKADSPYVADAWLALERARAAPGSDILPNQAALILASRTGIPQDRIWWEDMQAKLRSQAYSASNIVGLIALSNCVVDEICSFAQDDMMDTFAAALHRGPQPGVLSAFGKYALHVLRDPEFALRLWQEAALGDPGNPQFRVNLIILQIDLGKLEDARKNIRELRQLSRIGQFNEVADKLEQSLRKAQRTQMGGPAKQ